MTRDTTTARAALEAARHELTTLHGLIATDRPDLWDRALAFEIDVQSTLGVIDAALIDLSSHDEGLAKPLIAQPDLHSKLDQLLSELASINRSLRLVCK